MSGLWTQCVSCSLNQSTHLRTQRMEPTYPDLLEDPIAYILGEAPGRTEDSNNRQFVGEAGIFLRKYIPDWALPHIIWDNAVRCRPTEIMIGRWGTDYKNRTPSKAEITACSSNTQIYLDAVRPAAILGLGSVPLQWAWGKSENTPRMTSIRGMWFPVNGIPYFAAMHPSFAMRSNKRREVIRAMKISLHRKSSRLIYATFS